MSKGDFLLHLGPERHERLRKAAEAEGISMAQLLTDGMEMRIAAGQPGPESITAALRLVEKAARMLAERVPDTPGEPSDDAPAAEGAGAWQVMLERP